MATPTMTDHDHPAHGELVATRLQVDVVDQMGIGVHGLPVTARFYSDSGQSWTATKASNIDGAVHFVELHTSEIRIITVSAGREVDRIVAGRDNARLVLEV